MDRQSAGPRREDPALVTGEATFTRDLGADAAHVALARSRYGHARIEDVETAAAEAVAGVVGVYTAADVEASDAPGVVPVTWPGVAEGVPDQPFLARERVTYHGQPVAAVVAEDAHAARDAAERVEASYDRLEAVVDPDEALDSDVTIHDARPDNVAYEWEAGDEDATERAVADADRTVELDLVNQRLVSNPLEPRALVARYTGGRLDVTLPTQKPHRHRLMFADSLGLPENRVRVRAPSVGGGFGTKGHYYPDEATAAWCAVETGRAVTWRATRSETFLDDAHARDHVTEAELALDDDGTVRGLRVETTAAAGGYVLTNAPVVQTTIYGGLLSGQYEIPAIHCRVTGAFTNTVPVHSYRGAGRPEAIYVIERLMDEAARDLDLDPAEIRRRNLIPPDAFPYETPVGYTYDSGEYERALDAALSAVDYDDLRERQREAREAGRYLGVGIGSFVESAGSPRTRGSGVGPLPGSYGAGVVRFDPSGTATAYTSLPGQGQGHATTYARIVADEVGLPVEDVEVVQGDTERIPYGVGTSGSRGTAVGGGALAEAAREVRETARRIAAHRLEAAEADLAFEDGAFHVEGAPERSVEIDEVARVAYRGDVPEGVEPRLEASVTYDPENFTFPFGTHVAVVEVDPDTGEVEVLRYVAVDDCGVQIEPALVEGQIHGGVAQGIGQALYERVEYDDAGTLLTGSLGDYALPKAEHVPEMETESTVTPSPHNPLGVKGVGEAGTIAAPAAVANAVRDALAPLGVGHVDMPFTAERIWRAIGGER